MSAYYREIKLGDQETIEYQFREIVSGVASADNPPIKADGDVTVTVLDPRGRVLDADVPTILDADRTRYLITFNTEDSELGVYTFVWKATIAGQARQDETVVRVVKISEQDLAELACKPSEVRTKHTVIKYDSKLREALKLRPVTSRRLTKSRRRGVRKSFLD